ncbi:hypothetical protein B0H21DRAFT_892527 [Amylocystis lapponica]|nr:hypothetical protein B0H21DRAFT_892527 [Amylocystis lapponica]
MLWHGRTVSPRRHCPCASPAIMPSQTKCAGMLHSGKGVCARSERAPRAGRGKVHGSARTTPIKVISMQWTQLMTG